MAKIISDLFTEVRSVLRDDNANSYPDALMTNYYNRAITECWSLMVALGADVVMTHATITADGSAQDYLLPADYRALVIDKVQPRSPATATTNYTWSRPLQHVWLRDSPIVAFSSTVSTPNAFCTYTSSMDQYLRFSSIPPAGEKYDYSYYPLPASVTTGTIVSTFTPWLGLLDTLLSRILEEFCREGLEFVTTKRDQWRAKAEADIIALLGLRYLSEQVVNPSMFRNMP
jgi:hypothetical protein